MIRVVCPPGETPAEPNLRVESAQLDAVTDACLQDVFARHAENLAWYQANAGRIRDAHPDMYVAISGGEVFAGHTPAEADALARVAHPNSWNAAFRLFIRPRPG